MCSCFPLWCRHLWCNRMLTARSSCAETGQDLQFEGCACYLRCLCIAAQSVAARSHACELHVMPSISKRGRWWWSGINSVKLWHARYGGIFPHLVLLPLFLLSLGRPWCFLSTSIYSSAAVCLSGRVPGPTLLSSLLYDWLTYLKLCHVLYLWFAFLKCLF